MESQRASSSPSNKAKKRKALRVAFVVTATLGVGAMAGACGGSTTNPPETGCPAETPTDGNACEDPGTCNYSDECDGEIVATCGEEGTWSVEWGSSCNPPPPCPSELPTEGDECEFTPGGVPEGCSYEVQTACGPQTAAASCEQTGDLAYEWVITPPECTPTDPDCSLYTQATLCSSDTSCRWLVPGCEDEPLTPFEAGCFPIADCPADGCGLDQECSSVTYNPCFDAKCEACAAEATVCLPIVDGA
jgi:hypothetical protein